MNVVLNHSCVRHPRVDTDGLWRGVTEPALQSEFTHTALPHGGGVSVPERMRGLVRCSNPEGVQPSSEQSSHGVVAQWFAAPTALASDQEQEGRLGFSGTFVHHIPAHCIQRSGLVQVNDALSAGLTAGALRMIVPLPHGNAAMAVRNVIKVEAQGFAGAQPAVKHQEKDRQVTQARESAQECLNVVVGEGTWEPARYSDVDHAPHWALSACPTGERSVAVRNSGQCGIEPPQHRVLVLVVLLGGDRPVVKGRYASQDSPDARRRQQTLWLGRSTADHRSQAESLRGPAAWRAAQVLQESHRDGGPELPPSDVLTRQEREQVLQVVGVRARGVRTSAAVDQVIEELAHRRDGFAVVTKQPHPKYHSVLPFSHNAHQVLRCPGPFTGVIVNRGGVRRDRHFALECPDNAVTFWRVLRDQPDELARRCALTPHARLEHQGALLPAEDEVELARRVFVHLTQGRSGALNPTGWRRFTGSSSPAASMPRYLTGYLNRIHDCAERLARVSLECRPALQVIHDYGNAPSALLCLDPPYLLSTPARSPYPHSMRSEDDHRALAQAARACRAKVVISAYDSTLYRDLYADWHRTDLAATTHRGPTTTATRTEVLFSNTPLQPNAAARRRPLPAKRLAAGSEAA